MHTGTSSHESGQAPSLRILYLVPPTRGFAGIERVTHELAAVLDEVDSSRLEIRVAWGRRYDEESVRNASYHSVYLESPSLWRFAVDVRGVTRDFQPNIVICPQVEATSLVALAQPLRLKRKIVCHVHGNPVIEEQRGGHRTRLLYQAFSSVVVRRLAGLLAVSPDLEQYLQGRWGSVARTAYAINPSRQLHTTPRQRHEPARRFITVGRLAFQKGHTTLLRAFAAALADTPGLRLDIVGDGPLKEELLLLRDELGLTKCVIFHGHVGDPTPLLRDADCFVSASRWEGSPLVLIEAMQVGLPVIATNCDFGPRVLLADAVVGRLVEVDDVDALASAIVHQAASVPSASAAMEREKVAARHTPARAAQDHVRALAELVQPDATRHAAVVRLSADLVRGDGAAA